MQSESEIDDKLESVPLPPCVEVNVDYPGNDYIRGGIPGVTSALDCAAICELTLDCQFWTWTSGNSAEPWRKFRCWLKSGDDRTNLAYAYSAPRGCPPKEI